MIRARSDLHTISEGGMFGGFPQARSYAPTDMFMNFPDVFNDQHFKTFINTASITDAKQLNAVAFLVQMLKQKSLWDKMALLYPMVGETGAKHQYNLMNPGTFNLAYTNTPTHTSNGITFNGTNQRASTQFNPSTQGASVGITKDNCGIFMYNFSVTTGGLHGCDSGSPHYFIISNLTNVSALMAVNTGASLSSPLIVSPGNTSGCVIGSRLSNTPFVMFNKHIMSKSIVASALPSLVMYIGCRNSAGTPSNFMAGTMSTFGIHKGLTPDEALKLNDIITTYNIMLGRASTAIV